MSKERREARAERFAELAVKASHEADRRYDAANKISERFAGGQPILVGHHSEAGARRDQERINQNMSKSIESRDKAAYYADKAEAAANNTAIFSDAPDAIDLLKQKLQILERQREEIKVENKKRRKAGQEAAPAWMLSNLGANIRRVKRRIESLEREAARQEQGPVENRYDELGCTYRENAEEMRVQFVFDEKPDESVRDILKGWGFRWAPTFDDQPWQKHLNNNGRFAAKQVIKTLQQRIAPPEKSVESGDIRTALIEKLEPVALKEADKRATRNQTFCRQLNEFPTTDGLRYPFLKMVSLAGNGLETYCIKNTPENVAAFVLRHHSNRGEISVRSPEDIELMIANSGFILKCQDREYLTTRLNPVLCSMGRGAIPEPEEVDPSDYSLPEPGRLEAFYANAFTNGGTCNYSLLTEELCRVEAPMPDLEGDGNAENNL